jgi:hypothetical protein
MIKETHVLTVYMNNKTDALHPNSSSVEYTRIL